MGRGERRTIADLEAVIEDVYEAVASVAFELGALVEIERARALRELGHDPLFGSNYDHDRTQFERGLEEGEPRHHGQEPEFEPWVNQGHEEPEDEGHPRD